MYVQKFMFVSHSYFSLRDDALAGLLPPTHPHAYAAGPIDPGIDARPEPAHDPQQTDQPGQIAAPIRI
ncbi:hypothetical protein AB4851_06285 [Burkholderia sp. 22PA0099]